MPSFGTYSRRLGDPVFASVTLFGVASAISRSWTCLGVQDGLAERMRAAAPATCGEAMEVPPSEREPVSLRWEAETMSEPGPNRSRQVPWLEDLPLGQIDRASRLSVAPTVTALGTAAGEVLQALAPSLPAATT